MQSKLKPIFFGIIFLLLPIIAEADYLGQQVTFNIDPSYDLEKREEITATLQKINKKLYFYIDDSWWNEQLTTREEIFQALDLLALEFEKRIYPNLTQIFGSIPQPGIDGDERITVLIHPMVEEAGGYFNAGDEYPKIQNPKSNEREMIYLNSQHIEKAQAKSFLAHEFSHLITFNQKEILRKVSEETWLNEARAEYVSTLLGYDSEYKGSNLEKRVKTFLEKPNDSLTEWLNSRHDYGVVNLFTQYLVDHYGVKILVDSLHSQKVGIPSIDEALQKNSFKEDFSQIFTDWAIAVLVNDCSLGDKFCYKNSNLKNLRIVPQLNFLPLTGESSLEFTNANYDWSAHWYKIIGGKGKLIFEFNGQDEGHFEVSYLLCDFQGKCQVQNLSLNKKQEGKVVVSEFSEKYQSLITIPTIQTKISDFEKVQPTYLFILKVSIVKKTKEEEEAELRSKLLAQIEELKRQIAEYQAKINAILVEREKWVSCQRFDNDLYYGMRNNWEVKCLQEFLKAQGLEIYPEGLVTGDFLSLTKSSVIRFQEKYASEILAPLGLAKGTGFVGPATRAKINQLLNR